MTLFSKLIHKHGLEKFNVNNFLSPLSCFFLIIFQQHGSNIFRLTTFHDFSLTGKTFLFFQVFQSMWEPCNNVHSSLLATLAYITFPVFRYTIQLTNSALITTFRNWGYRQILWCYIHIICIIDSLHFWIRSRHGWCAWSWT